MGMPAYGQATVSAPEALLMHDPSGKYTIKHQGSFAVVEAKLTPGDIIKAEGDAMITMPRELELGVNMEGGCCVGCCRCCCAGSSLYISTFSIPSGAATKFPGGVADILLAPSLPGDALLLDLKGDVQFVAQKGAFVCCDEGVSVGVHMNSCAQGCCGGEGFFMQKFSGTGRLVLGAFGSIIRYDLKPGEVRVIDNGVIVAFPSNIKWEIGTPSDTLWNTCTSGEGFITRFTGPGTVYIQTRTIAGVQKQLQPYFEVIGRSGG
jgi:uncharacterized protein (TIGR00266 family)